MKNLLVALGLCCAMLFIPTESFATSGACSGHGGVNCSAGSDYDGSVICSDGWRNSSVSYSSMVMCRSYSSPTPSYSSSVSCPSMSSYDVLTGGCKCWSGYVVGKDFLGNEACISKDDRCTKLYGYGAKYDSSSDECVCKDFYTFNGSSCVFDTSSFTSYSAPVYSAPTSCPLYSTLNREGKCSCIEGYQVSVDKASCVEITCPADSKLVRDDCVCNDGYFERNGVCVSRTGECMAVFGPYSYGLKASDGSNQCGCTVGYQWDLSKTSCIKIPEQKPLSTGIIESMPVSEPVVLATNEDMALYCRKTLGDKGVFSDLTGSCICEQGSILNKGVCVSKYFTGSPKTKTDLLNCLIVGDIKAKKYYLRGSKLIKTMSIQGKYCANDEDVFKKSNYKKGK